MVLIATLALVLTGLYSVKNTPVDAIPDLSDVQVIIKPQSQLKSLVIKGKEQGYLTYAEVNDHPCLLQRSYVRSRAEYLLTQ